MQRRHLLQSLAGTGLALGGGHLWAAGPAQPCFLVVLFRRRPPENCEGDRYHLSRFINGLHDALQVAHPCVRLKTARHRENSYALTLTLKTTTT